MITYVRYEHLTGRVIGYGRAQVVPEDDAFGYMAYPGDVSDTRMLTVVDGAVLTRPTLESEWDEDAEAWVVNLSALRARRWEYLKGRRAAALAEPVPFAGGFYDADPASVQNVTGAVLAAMIDPTATWEWTRADNTVAQLDATQITGLAQAMAAQVAAAHARGRAVRAELEAAATAAEIEAIDW